MNFTLLLGKLIESLIKDRIVQHMDKYNLIGSNPHNVSKGKACFSNLLKCFEKVNKIVDKGALVNIIYLDFQKTRNTVLHKRLLREKYNYEVRGKISQWIKN